MREYGLDGSELFFLVAPISNIHGSLVIPEAAIVEKSASMENETLAKWRSLKENWKQEITHLFRS